jgi:hypothetical protein
MRYSRPVQQASDDLFWGDRMQRELRDLGIDFYKTHRMYEREL